MCTRPLQNESTGIDLQVPLYREIRGSMMTGHVEYQIVVVTRLAAFKSPKHRPGDIVQLLVSKKYSEMDEFYCKLAARYPTIPLPAMPRKALFVGESDIRERRAAFDELLKFISKNPTLASCPELLEFLGAKATDAVDFKTRKVPDWEGEDEEEGLDFFRKDEPPAAKAAAAPKPAPPHDEDEEEEEILDPLGIMRSKKPKQKRTPEPEKPAAKPTAPKFTLFDEEVDPDEELFEPAAWSSADKHGPLKLFEDPDLGGAVKSGDALLLPTAYRGGGVELSVEREDDVDELLRVDEDLDKVLTVSKVMKPEPVAPAVKPKVAPKPALPKKPVSSSQSGAAPPPKTKAETMDQMDILRYIQQNESSAAGDADLF
uniref:HCLS1 binding protein 3 n=1 Tax=Scleropages formosus TaxID=113540 RepID=A0A8C9W8F0_SCLFO